MRVFESFGNDLRLASRRLLATPMFTIFAIVSLAVGVGVTTAVYSVVDRIFWKELGIESPETVALVMGAESGAYDARWVMSERDYTDVGATQTSFVRLAASQPVYPAVATEAITEIQLGEAVDGEYFALMGVTPLIGRAIQPSDDASNAAVVVLSHALWKMRFAGNAGVVGQVVRLSGKPFEIVGVAPASFGGPVPGPTGTRLWVPRSAAPLFEFRNPASTAPERERRRLTVIGRLRPGRTIEQATSELDALGTSMDAAFPRRPSNQPGIKARRGWTAKSVATLNERGEDFRRFGVLVFGLIALVLVVACTNLANLVLARGTMRQQEFAVRRALGASRWRLVREQSCESLLLAIGGGLSAWLLMQVLINTFDFEVPMARSWMVSVQPEISAGALAMSAGALLLSLVVFGLEPALQLTKTEVRADLAAGSGSVGVPKAKRQRTLLRWQVAISAGFFIIATMCVRFLAAEAGHDPGVDLDRFGVASVDFYIQRMDEDQARRTAEQILVAVREQPGIEAVAVSTGMPFGTQSTPSLVVSTVDKPIISSSDQKSIDLVIGTPDFFRASGISIVHGRSFDNRDHAAASPSVVLSELSALRLFGTAQVVGRSVLIQVRTRLPGLPGEQTIRTATIVGVAEDTDTGNFPGRRGEMAYMPLTQAYSPWMTVVARAADTSTATGALRAGIRKAAPDLGVTSIGSGQAVLAGPFAFLRSAALIAVSLGALTLLLAMVGLYGVQSHIVAHRTREIGVRMSLGATAAQIRAMVLKDGYKPVLQGLAIGLFIGLAGRAIVRSYVAVEVAVFDPWMLLLVPIPLLLAAFFACFLPARRASLVDPNVALRHL